MSDQQDSDCAAWCCYVSQGPDTRQVYLFTVQSPFWLQVEELFQAAQVRKLEEKKPAIKQLAILDVKRATGIGIRMAGLR